ncbi:MAG: hypothetical protein KY456_14685 [Chloroflexi bacterium]|nr:hypothetical protein [Chloroflexota bacterium]
METTIKHRVAAGALALSLLGGTGVGVAAQGNGNQTGGAAGLVAAIVQVRDVTGVQVQVVDSLNNLRALNNVLNNSPILSQNDIDISDIDIITGNNVQVFVENNDIDLTVLGVELDDIVAILVLDTGDILVLI